jgi:hypothetical protein
MPITNPLARLGSKTNVGNSTKNLTTPAEATGAEGMRRAISLKNVAEALHIMPHSPVKGKLTPNKSFKTLTGLSN